MTDPRGSQVDAVMLWGLASCAGVAAGSLGPWITLGPISAGGTSGGRDGIITLALAAIAAVCVAARGGHLFVAVLALAAFGTGVYDTTTISNSDDGALFTPSIGWGLILVDLAALSLLAWAIHQLVASRDS